MFPWSEELGVQQRRLWCRLYCAGMGPQANTSPSGRRIVPLRILLMSTKPIIRKQRPGETPGWVRMFPATAAPGHLNSSSIFDHFSVGGSDTAAVTQKSLFLLQISIWSPNNTCPLGGCPTDCHIKGQLYDFSGARGHVLTRYRQYRVPYASSPGSCHSAGLNARCTLGYRVGVSASCLYETYPAS